jgi:hypothetical protein
MRFSVKVLAEPVDGQPLSLFAFLCIDSVVLDVIDCDQFLYAFRPTESGDGVIFVVEQFFVLRDDEKHGAIVASIDVFDGGVPHQLFPHGLAGHTTKLRKGFGVTNLAASSL